MIEYKDIKFKPDGFGNMFILISVKNGEEVKTKQQILNDREKARKWDKLALDEEDKDITLYGAKIIKQNQKLRELIERRVRERTQPDTIFVSTDFYVNLIDDVLTKIFQQLLEESKE